MPIFPHFTRGAVVTVSPSGMVLTAAQVVWADVHTQGGLPLRDFEQGNMVGDGVQSSATVLA